MTNELTTFGNLLIVVTSILGVGYFHYWLWHNTITDNTKGVVWAWIIKEVAVFFRIGWWIFALILATGDETYHPWFVEQKHWVTLPTSLAYIGGQVMFIYHIVGLSRWRCIGLIGVAVSIAATVTLIGF